ncbi:helix-turn-helix transcriptional regulator [Staphylococcus capitis]|uniref:helix-turn-helix domain-containing protein n=1 Tax=Staphylococcus TaxID=1279 RepID=UPI0002D409B8|nr:MULTISPECIES: helix-turn-helix transcriptional regulator [Staphylococcus]MBC3087767.1 helix-turn-helix transcriptional regulator [Staphylococcus capitis]MCK6221737.1 helix-turn-helix domain-containing protein [Staphylococcus capitis]MDS3986430.1 helix-turn-helix transcriptional regulator [Staphylococcus capitis]MDS3993240.1 helix-turn-helix transcriptional regulator [Staphylococcus capitis]MDS3995598.1 helix-turn-helix transcriptional regulator [Staphylococcus capitis]
MSMISKLIDEDIKRYPELEKSYKEQSEALDIAEKVVNLRKEMGWSQRQLAEAMNIPQSTIARIENGDVLPRIDTMQAIANVTNKRLKIEYV